MPSKSTKQTPEQKRIVELKKRYIEYYRELPVQRYAAMSIARNEDTIIAWKTADPEFSDAVTEAKASWVHKKAGRVRPEFALERLEKEIWSPRTELTGADGKDLPAPILGGVSALRTNDGDKKAA